LFSSLADRLQSIFKTLRGEARLTESSVDAALREIRLALLEADVNFRVVKAFADRVRAKAVGEDVLGSLTPAQQVVRVVRDEMLALFGDAQGGLPPATRSPRVMLMLGLQGSGKTTTSAKLARWVQKQGRHPLLVSTDVRRPAAIQQLSVLAGQAGVRVHDPEGETDPVARASGALAACRTLGFDTLIVDTAGRLHIDDELMGELTAIKQAVEPTDLFFVADAMTGQDAVKSAGEFHARVGVSGVVLTKLDGDARGGAALSVVGVVGVPIAFVGIGERLQDLEPFHADRLVSRILGMGDVLTLIERAEEAIDESDRARLAQTTRLDDFTLEAFRDQLLALKKMGPLEQVLGMIPGLGGLKSAAGVQGQVDEGQLRRVEAMINSMTPAERRNHAIINGSRRKRIARGSGTTVEEVNRMLKQFLEMRRVFKAVGGMAGGGRKGRQRLMGMLRGRR
jgi:signal recognition particle subunit SRP54